MSSILFLGDSITDCGHCFDPDGLGNGYVSLLSEAPALAGFSLVNRGHDGFTAGDVRRCLRSFPVPADCALISLLVGVNDAALFFSGNRGHVPDGFYRSFSVLLSELRAASDAPLLVMEPFLFSSPAELLAWSSVLMQISEIIEEVCLFYGARFVPLCARFLDAEKERGTAALSPDGVHLTPAGASLLAGEWLTAALPLLSQPGVFCVS